MNLRTSPELPQDMHDNTDEKRVSKTIALLESVVTIPLAYRLTDIPN